jgi:hypothetical protein
MILESFPEGFEGRTVILLHSGARVEVAELQAAFRALANQPGGGFQYLDARDGPVVIYSTGRTW